MMVNEESERVTRLDESEMNTPRLKAYGKGSRTNDKIYTHEWVDTECIMMTQSDLEHNLRLVVLRYYLHSPGSSITWTANGWVSMR